MATWHTMRCCVIAVTVRKLIPGLLRASTQRCVSPESQFIRQAATPKASEAGKQDSTNPWREESVDGNSSSEDHHIPLPPCALAESLKASPLIHFLRED